MKYVGNFFCFQKWVDQRELIVRVSIFPRFPTRGRLSGCQLQIPETHQNPLHCQTYWWTCILWCFQLMSLELCEGEELEKIITGHSTIAYLWEPQNPPCHQTYRWIGILCLLSIDVAWALWRTRTNLLRGILQLHTSENLRIPSTVKHIGDVVFCACFLLMTLELELCDDWGKLKHLYSLVAILVNTSKSPTQS